MDDAHQLQQLGDFTISPKLLDFLKQLSSVTVPAAALEPEISLPRMVRGNVLKPATVKSNYNQ